MVKENKRKNQETEIESVIEINRNVKCASPTLGDMKNMYSPFTLMDHKHGHLPTNIDKVTKSQRSIERQMLHIKLIDIRRNEWIRNKTKVRDVREVVARLI